MPITNPINRLDANSNEVSNKPIDWFISLVSFINECLSRLLTKGIGVNRNYLIYTHALGHTLIKHYRAGRLANPQAVLFSTTFISESGLGLAIT